MLEAPDDVYDEAAGIATNLTETCGEYAANEDFAAPEVTEELNRLKTFRRSYREPIIDETMPRGHVYSQMTETVRGRLVDDMKNDRDKSRFVAGKLARDVKHDVRAGTSVLKALRMTINLATMRDGKHRLRNSVFYDITATFAHASIDEVVVISPQGGLLEKRERPLVLKALYGTWMASKRWQRHHMRMLGTHEWTASKTMPSFFQHRNHAGTCGCHGSDMTEGSDDAVQAGGFSLKEVITGSHGSDLTSKRHDKERRTVLMTVRRLRYTRERGEAVSTASEGQSAAAVNAVVNATWLKPRVGTLSQADPGGCEASKLGDGRLAEMGRGQRASIALDGRQSGHTSN